MDLLIDGDIVCYNSGFAADTEVELHGGDGLMISLSHTRKSIAATEKYLRETFNIQRVFLFLTADDKSNFRYAVAKTQPYHGNRDTSKRPVYYKEIRDYLVTHHGAVMVSGMEADDEMGIRSSKSPNSTIIASIDKDLRMIPGWHYEGGEKPPFFTQDPGYLYLRQTPSKMQLFGTGKAWFYAQCLMGDRADHIPGLPGVGDIKAYEILHKFKDEEDLEKRVVQAYTNVGLCGRLEEIKELLWIRRS